MREYRVAVIPGDGIGIDTIDQAVRTLQTVCEVHGGLSLSFECYDWGCQYYLRTGEMMPKDGLNILADHDAILLGAVGFPSVPDHVSLWGLLIPIRRAFRQYVNLRPVKLLPGVWTPIKDKGPEDIDFVVVRENTEGLYTSTGGFLKKGTPDEVAVQESVNTRMGVERCLRYAFEYARRPDRHGRLTLCGKTNVLTYAWDLWWRAFNEIGDADYPDVKRDYAHVDAISMWFLKNPEWFDVIVTDNMFGDIITDQAAMIQGGLGVAAGGNIHPERCSMFEPMGGSAPKYEGLNVINPLAAIAAAGMMLDFLHRPEAAVEVEKGMVYAISKMESLAAGQMGMGTSDVGDLVARYVAEGGAA